MRSLRSSQIFKIKITKIAKQRLAVFCLWMMSISSLVIKCVLTSVHIYTHLWHGRRLQSRDLGNRLLPMTACFEGLRQGRLLEEIPQEHVNVPPPHQRWGMALASGRWSNWRKTMSLPWLWKVLSLMNWKTPSIKSHLQTYTKTPTWASLQCYF